MVFVVLIVFFFPRTNIASLYVLATAFPTFGHLRDAVLIGLTDGDAAARTPPRDCSNQKEDIDKEDIRQTKKVKKKGRRRQTRRPFNEGGKDNDDDESSRS